MQYGNLLSLPFADGMLYVEPVYVKSNQQDAYPLLQKVLLSYGDGGSYVVLADNLNDGIKQLVDQGKKAGQGTPPPPTTGRQPAPHAAAHAGRRALRRSTGELAAAAERVQTAITEVRGRADVRRLRAVRPRAEGPGRGDHRIPAGAAGRDAERHPVAERQRCATLADRHPERGRLIARSGSARGALDVGPVRS